MLSRIYAKIKSSRIKSVLQYYYNTEWVNLPRVGGVESMMMESDVAFVQSPAPLQLIKVT